jgi:GTPase Era involved in 16S rRNA processing
MNHKAGFIAVIGRPNVGKVVVFAQTFASVLATAF